MTQTNQLHMNTHFSIITDTATLAIYDPVTIKKHNPENDPSWWIDYLDVEEVQRGEMSLINLQADGHYTFRITSTALTQSERLSAIAVINDLGVEISSGTLCISSGEAMQSTSDKENDNVLIPCPNGKYSLSAYTLDSENDKNPCCVLVLQPREKTFVVPDTEPQLDFMSQTYLFKKPPKLKFGLILKGKVIKTPKTEFEFCVRENSVEGCKSWPRNYPDKVILKDFSTLKRGDRITFKSIAHDSERDIIMGELISLDWSKNH